MKEIKKNKVVENVNELVAKNQEVIDALKRLNSKITQDFSNQKSKSVCGTTDNQLDE